MTKSFKASHKKYCQTVDLDDVLLQLAELVSGVGLPGPGNLDCVLLQLEEHVGGVGLPGPGHLDDDGRFQQADV